MHPANTPNGPTSHEWTLLHQLAELGVRKACADPGFSPQRLEQLLQQLPPELTHPAGVFVTLTRQGALRGCIGYILPHKPLHEAVFENGYNAAARDPRFSPLSQAELAGLEIEVNLLSPPQAIPSAEDFTPGTQGIILHKAGHTAVFLPEVARQQGWDREQTLSHLARKAGLAADAWREGCELEVFSSRAYQAPLGTHLPPLEG